MTRRKARLGRGWSHRLAMLRTMVTQLIQHERIETTHPKAKELAKMADSCVTLAKKGTPAARSQAEAIIRTPVEVHKLFTVLAQRYERREGGYTRVIRCRTRLGDAAPMSIIEFVDRDGELRRARPPRSMLTPSPNIKLPLAARTLLTNAE
eukprot:TRINITY_DN6693_c0_g3_i2.p1 TRINITY_DN6693_c0_g3~~TRINITY_DN6693_c0_g3_i2.p1  ORF type:complete len:151 (+),score=7.82 TRINITY_DN6693_c0_g3_i2:195-647(+)